MASTVRSTRPFQHYRRLLASLLYDELVPDRLIAVLKPEYVPFISESTEGSFTARKSLERWHHFNTTAYLRVEKLVWCYVCSCSYYPWAKGKGTLLQTGPPCRDLLAPERAGAPREDPQAQRKGGHPFRAFEFVEELPEITRSPTSLPGE